MAPDLPGEDTVKDILKETSRQGGPIALLAVMLVAAMLAGIGAIGYVLVPVMKDYISASTATIESNAESFMQLSQSMTTVHKSHSDMMNALEQTQAAVSSNGDQIKLSTESAKEMLEMMKDAYTMMASAPKDRSEQLVLLRRIEAGITELNSRMEAQSGP